MKFSFSLFIFLILFLACKKDKKESVTERPSLGHPLTCPPVEPILDTSILASKFQKGSFWVFKDSLTNRLDTLIVDSVSTCSQCTSMDSNSPCYVETFNVNCSFKNDTDKVLKSFSLYVQEKGIVFNSPFFWTVGSQPIPLLYVPQKFYTQTTYTMFDSLFITDRYYSKVAATYAIQFVTQNANRMYSQSLKCYFNSYVGFLQFDFKDRLTNELKGRRKIISRNIIR